MQALQQSSIRGDDRTRVRKETLRYGIVLVATIALTALNGIFLRYFDLAGLPAVFGLDLLIQILLIVLVLYSLVVVLRTPLRVLGSIVVSALRGVEQNEYVQRAVVRVPGLLPWLKRRFARDRPTGLALTLGVLATAALLLTFVSLSRAVAAGTYFALDQRVVNLMPSIRTDAETAFFAFFTFAASFAGIIFFLLVLAIAARLRRLWWLPAYFVLAYLTETLFLNLSKVLIQRPRPDPALHAFLRVRIQLP